MIGEVIGAVRASQTATELLDDAVARYLGIHRTDYRCLDILDQEGPMTAGRLAERARLSPGATTTVIDRLERKGLARRTRDAADRRRVLVEVDPSLRRQAARLYGSPEDALSAFDAYTDEQLELLVDFLRGSVAFQEQVMHRLEALQAAEVENAPSAPTDG